VLSVCHSSISAAGKKHLYGTEKFETEIAGRKLVIETGLLANQANASVTVRYGDTMVLATTVMSPEAREGVNYFPLMVDYEEKFYASGKIKGSRFIKREGRPTDEAILNAVLLTALCGRFSTNKCEMRSRWSSQFFPLTRRTTRHSSGYRRFSGSFYFQYSLERPGRSSANRRERRKHYDQSDER